MRALTPVVALSSMLVLSSPAGASTPVLSPEFVVETPVYGAGGASQGTPAVAYDGGAGWLVVWGDDRSGTHAIYGGRVSESGGGLVEGAGIFIGEGYSPAVAFDGTNFLVVWSTDATAGDIRGARVGRGGEVLDPGGFTISAQATHEVAPDVAFDGSSYLVVWLDAGSVRGARVGVGGGVIDAVPLTISATGWEPKLASGGGAHLVVWTAYQAGSTLGDVFAARITAQGQVLDVGGFPVSALATDERAPDVGFDGTNWLVVWEDRRTGTSDVFGGRVDASGALLDAPGFLIGTAGHSPAVAFEASTYLVVWDRSTSATTAVLGARITVAGDMLEPAGFVVADAADWQHDAAVATGGIAALVAWVDWSVRPAGPDIRAVRVSGSALLSPNDVLVSPTPGRQDRPGLAFDGTNVLATWLDFRDGIARAYAALVSASGSPLDVPAIALGGVGSEYAAAPAAAFGATDYLVVWEDVSARAIRAARVSASGVLLDAQPRTLAQATGSPYDYVRGPAVSSDGTNWLILWGKGGWAGEGPWYSYIDGALLGPDGTTLAHPGVWAPGGSVGGDPAVAFDGTRFFASWTNGELIQGTWIERDGTVAGAFPIWAETRASAPAVAFDEANLLVAWDGGMFGEADVRAVRIGPAGTVLDTTPIPVAATAGDQHGVSLAFDGTNHLAVWMDAGSGLYDVRAARISSDGAVLDAGGIAVSGVRERAFATPPAVVSLGNGRAMAAYAARDGASGLQRILARIIDEGPPPVSDADADGISDALDLDPASPSGAFADAAGTTGVVAENASGLDVQVTDLPDPQGVTVTVGAGTGSVTVQACGFTLVVHAASVVDVTCGSLTARVRAGTAVVLLGGGITTVSLPTGTEARVVANADGSFTVDNTGAADVTLAVDGIAVKLPPAERKVVRDWHFVGFDVPVDPAPTVNVAKAGQGVPLKWRVTRADGTPVTDLATARVDTRTFACSGEGGDTIEETAAGGSGLQNLGGGSYQINWKTPVEYAGSCRILRLDLGEGIVREALFRFRR